MPQRAYRDYRRRRPPISATRLQQAADYASHEPTTPRARARYLDGLFARTPTVKVRRPSTAGSSAAAGHSPSAGSRRLRRRRSGAADDDGEGHWGGEEEDDEDGPHQATLVHVEPVQTPGQRNELKVRIAGISLDVVSGRQLQQNATCACACRLRPSVPPARTCSTSQAEEELERLTTPRQDDASPDAATSTKQQHGGAAAAAATSLPSPLTRLDTIKAKVRSRLLSLPSQCTASSPYAQAPLLIPGMRVLLRRPPAAAPDCA